MTLLHYLFDLTSFYRLGQKYKNVFVRFLVQMKTLKSPFEINWPLTLQCNVQFEQYWTMIMFISKTKIYIYICIDIDIFFRLISINSLFKTLISFEHQNRANKVAMLVASYLAPHFITGLLQLLLMKARQLSTWRFNLELKIIAIFS